MRQRIFENPAIRDKVTVLLTGEETGGDHILLEVELQAGGSIPMHYHTSFAEAFTVVEGVLGIDLAKEKLRLSPGQQMEVAIGQWHRFYNPGDTPIRFQVKIAPGEEKFLQSLSIGYGLAGDGKVNRKGTPKSLDHLAILFELSDTRFTGFLSLVTPLLLRRAKRARRRGADKLLMEKYW